MDIIKTIIPAAGIGSPFLPITKAIPQEMLPLINKPAIDYIVQETLSSHVEQIIMILGRNKQTIADYFDNYSQLDTILDEEQQKNKLSGLAKIIRSAQFSYIHQSQPLGLGQAILAARSLIMPKEYFGILLPDDIIVSKTPALEQLIRIARQEKASVIAVQEVPAECIPLYGIIDIKKQITPNLFQVNRLIEKPSQTEAPSNLAVVGRYVLSQKIFDGLNSAQNYTEGDLHLTDGITHMISQNEKVFAYKISGIRYDIGTPLGWIKAVIGMGLNNPHYSPYLKKFLTNWDTLDSFLYNQEKNITHL